MEAQQQLQRPHRAEAIKKMVIDRKAELLGAVSVLALMVGGILLAAKSGAEMAWLPGPAMSLARTAAPSPVEVSKEFIDHLVANELTDAAALTTSQDADRATRQVRGLAERMQAFETLDPGRLERGQLDAGKSKGDEMSVFFFPGKKALMDAPDHLLPQEFVLMRNGSQWRIDIDESASRQEWVRAVAKGFRSDRMMKKLLGTGRARGGESAQAKQKFDMFSSGKKVQCEKFGVGC